MAGYDDEVKFSVVVGFYDCYNEYPFMSQYKNEMHYKSAANKIAHLIANDVRYDGVGNPTWNTPIGVYSKVEIIQVHHDGSVNTIGDSVMPNEFGPAMYVVTAIQRVVYEMRMDANQWMTPVEIEKFCDLKPGVVRKHIFDHRKFVEDNNLVKKADGRTLLIKRGYALNRWGKHGQEKK